MYSIIQPKQFPQKENHLPNPLRTKHHPNPLLSLPTLYIHPSIHHPHLSLLKSHLSPLTSNPSPPNSSPRTNIRVIRKRTDLRVYRREDERRGCGGGLSGRLGRKKKGEGGGEVGKGRFLLWLGLLGVRKGGREEGMVLLR